MYISMNLLATIIKSRGSIPTVRVSSAQARGKAKNYPYWGAVRYELRASDDGTVRNVPLERASSDRRSIVLAEQDAKQICQTEGRILCQSIGVITPEETRLVLDLVMRGEVHARSNS